MAGQLTGGHRTAYVEGVGAPGQPQLLGATGDGAVEVQGISEVELGLHEGGAGEGDLVVVESDVATLGGLHGVGFCLLGHEPGHSLGDEPVELGRAGPVRERRHLGVHERGGLSGQPEGGLRDPASLPRRQPIGLTSTLDASLGPRQPVLQLQAVRDEHPAGVGGATGRGRELRDAELRDRRRALTGQRQHALGARPGRRQPDRLRRVLLGPGHRRMQQIGLRPVGSRAGGPGRTRAPPRRCRGRPGSSSYPEFKQRPLTVSDRESPVHTGNSRLCSCSSFTRPIFHAYFLPSPPTNTPSRGPSSVAR